MTTTFKRPCPNYVWCDYHGEIHAAKPDPYEEGESCRAHWRRVYVASTDRRESFA